jgi:hypothetical protein
VVVIGHRWTKLRGSLATTRCSITARGGIAPKSGVDVCGPFGHTSRYALLPPATSGLSTTCPSQVARRPPTAAQCGYAVDKSVLSRSGARARTSRMALPEG